MAKTYQVNSMTRFFNRLMGTFLRLGMGPKNLYLLTVRGRKTGTSYSAPVSLIQEGETRWLVSAYGEMNWVKNARAAGQVTLTKGGRSETVTVTELPPQESALVLKRYLAREQIVRPYFDVQYDAPMEAFVAEAPRHPVFLLR
jgi:deazaflavin-dependent oxidoreductase (nitroreductase family)